MQANAECLCDLAQSGDRRVRPRALQLGDLLLRNPDARRKLPLGESGLLPRPAQRDGNSDLGVDLDRNRAAY